MINYNVPLNSRGQNKLIKGNILDDNTMKTNGFRLRSDKWCLMENLGRKILLYITISQSGICIDIIDDEFCQPYDYQNMHTKNSVAMGIHSKVQATMKRLGDAGIIEGYVINDYI